MVWGYYMESVKQIFDYMNDIDFPYVVLRNWDNLPFNVELGEHSDLDLLVYDLEHWKEIFPDAHQEYPYPRVRYKIDIEGEGHIYVDVRHIGDDYYPEGFENAIIETREWNSKGFFTPNPIHFRLALAYHAVHHKNVNNYKRWLGDAGIKEMAEALRNSDLGYTLPKDPSVGRYHQYWKGATAIVKNEGDVVTKQQVSWNNYDLIANENRILKDIKSPHFPEVVSYDPKEKIVALRHCGEPLDANTTPSNWESQLREILKELKKQKMEKNVLIVERFMKKLN